MRRGYIIIDTAFGLTLIGVLIALLGAAATQYQRSTRQMARQRQAMHLAEMAIARLQAGEPVDADVAILPDSPANLPEHRWVTISIQVDGVSARLTGLVPADRLDQAREVAP